MATVSPIRPTARHTATSEREAAASPIGWIDYQARRVPDKTAITELSTGRSRSYAELRDRITRLARHLTVLGIGRGDRIAVLSHNSANVFEVMYACAHIGAIMVPMNWRLSPHELRAIARDFAPSAVFFDPDNAEAAAGLTEDAPRLHQVSWDDGVDNAYERAIAAAAEPASAIHRAAETDPWVIIYTSGTTGQPKGAVHTLRSVTANLENSAFAGNVHADSVALTVLPTFHVAGLHLYANAALMHGGTVLIAKTFDPAETLRLFADTALGITHFCGVPAHYQFMAADPDFQHLDLPPLLATVGGSPVPAAMIRTWRDRGVNMMPIYGATEAGSSLLAMPPRGSSGTAAIGIPLRHVEATIRDDSGTEVAVGEVGELWLRGPMTMHSYWGKPEETAKALTEDGLLRTGDAASVDPDGIFHIVDRWKDMYISGGENVYPAEVENVLYQHPDIVLASVIGIPDTKWGETGKAYVVPADGRTVESEQLRAWCRERLAPYKVPSQIEFRTDLPRNATGKIVKNKLRNEQA
ncbi:class I adenylate-forming enzyme family protein [Rhodococcus jostii]|uniref:AMP-binding protein n=1 Tax=Rhodococcus jostii TaxID=132919 RepID=A0ABU4CLV3_RHOJO|nr:AMP-binding protein [Rhodococcus jostii]MDV6284548.1 AMP-binding protein [Rhodococcus jostii]